MEMNYTVSQDENGFWYAHKVGFSYIPCMIDGRHTFCKTKKEALNNAAMKMGLTYKEYMILRRRYRHE